MLRCQHCNAIYMVQKFSAVSPGMLTNSGIECPGCKRRDVAAVVISCVKG